MANQKLKTQNNELIGWMSYRTGKLAEIEEVKEDVKNKTETERAKLKSLRHNVTIATFKIDQLMDSLKEEVEANEEVKTTLTLDDFDMEGKEINIELAEQEYKASTEDGD